MAVAAPAGLVVESRANVERAQTLPFEEAGVERVEEVVAEVYVDECRSTRAERVRRQVAQVVAVEVERLEPRRLQRVRLHEVQIVARELKLAQVTLRHRRARRQLAQIVVGEAQALGDLHVAQRLRRYRLQLQLLERETFDCEPLAGARLKQQHAVRGPDAADQLHVAGGSHTVEHVVLELQVLVAAQHELLQALTRRPAIERQALEARVVREAHALQTESRQRGTGELRVVHFELLELAERCEPVERLDDAVAHQQPRRALHPPAARPLGRSSPV